jgi:hypothetical protein
MPEQWWKGAEAEADLHEVKVFGRVMTSSRTNEVFDLEEAVLEQRGLGTERPAHH